MVTGGAEEIHNRPHMMTQIQEEIPYCSPGTSQTEEGGLHKSATISQ